MQHARFDVATANSTSECGTPDAWNSSQQAPQPSQTLTSPFQPHVLPAIVPNQHRLVLDSAYAMTSAMTSAMAHQSRGSFEQHIAVCRPEGRLASKPDTLQLLTLRSLVAREFVCVLWLVRSLSRNLPFVDTRNLF